VFSLTELRELGDKMAARRAEVNRAG
jgi:hypothetical protein